MDSYLRVGKILKPQGIKGEFKVEPLTDNMARFDSMDTVFIESQGSFTPFAVATAKFRDGFLYLSLDKIADRNAAELLRNSYLYVTQEDALELPEDTYFIDDLIGCAVYSDEGKRLGELQEIIKTGANDVFSIQTGQGELLVPALKKVVLMVEPGDKRITLDGKVLKEVADFED